MSLETLPLFCGLLGLLLDVWLVGQELAPRKCVLMMRAVWSDMRRWVVTDDGDRWSVKLDVRDLGVRREAS